MYNRVDAEKPDKGLIIFSAVSVRNGKEPLEIRWFRYVSMFKYYIKNPEIRMSEEDTYNTLVEAMYGIIGKNQVDELLAYVVTE